MGGNRRRGRARRSKTSDADKSIIHLSRVLNSELSGDSNIADSAARQLIGIGKKHGIRPEPSIRRLMCRSCKKSMLPGRTSRVRITPRSINTTCLRCERVYRESRKMR